MPITENEMAAIREMFLDAAGSLIAAHQAHMDDRFREVQAGFAGVHERLDRLESRMEAFEARMETLETRMEGLEARVGAVESQVSQLVRLDALERRMAEFEARLSG